MLVYGWASPAERRPLLVTLKSATGASIQVLCDGQASHMFGMAILVPSLATRDSPEFHPDDLPEYGKQLYTALFPEGSLAQQRLAAERHGIVLIAECEDLQAVPWEYLCGPQGPVVLQYPFVRGLPEDQRIPTPDLRGGLHIVAVPSNPLSDQIIPLDIEGEWHRLQQVVEGLPYAVTLERCRPPTIEQLRRLVGQAQGRVVHFMGHGMIPQIEGGLVFENERGAPRGVGTQELLARIGSGTFLVTLNACVSASPGQTRFGNMALALVRGGVPYALGMGLCISDDDARAFSREFYSELGRGLGVEVALHQARLTLAHSERKWAFGVAMYGGEPGALGQGLKGVYRQVWQAIVQAVAAQR